MRRTNRDDFSRKTQIQIMQKSGYRCSYPGCEKVLIGPSKDLKKPVYVGIVAHICAASPRGPRYDPRMTHEERFGEENGILLCREHAALIDIDDSPYDRILIQLTGLFLRQLKHVRKFTERRAKKYPSV